MMDLEIRLLDTALLAPAGFKDLASLGQFVGLEKRDIGENIKTMEIFINEQPTKFSNYAMIDFVIALSYWLSILNLTHGERTILLTVAGISVADTLVFNYNPQKHSVLSVTGSAFAACDTKEPLQVWAYGNTKVTLEQAGRMWFICGTPTHCSNGQAFKVTVNAAQSGAANAPIKASKAAVIIAGVCLHLL